jgi:hypothetical protein
MVPLDDEGPARLAVGEEGLLVARADRSKRDSYQAVVARSGEEEWTAEYHTKEKEDRKSFATHSFGAHFVEVRVDDQLGEVRAPRPRTGFAWQDTWRWPFPSRPAIDRRASIAVATYAQPSRTALRPGLGFPTAPRLRGHSAQRHPCVANDAAAVADPQATGQPSRVA